jgi:hypothetical protein
MTEMEFLSALTMSIGEDMPITDPEIRAIILW